MLRLVTLMTVLAYGSAQSAAKYPAGVDPNKCPNFPICDNAALHQGNRVDQWNAQPYQAPAPAPQWNQWNAQPAPQWNAQPAPQWNAQPAPQWNAQPAPQWNAQPSAPTGGDKFPAGVSPQSCPNYPYCDTNAQFGGHNVAAKAAPLEGFTERLYPAGVSPHSCPNYPLCN